MQKVRTDLSRSVPPCFWFGGKSRGELPWVAHKQEFELWLEWKWPQPETHGAPHPQTCSNYDCATSIHTPDPFPQLSQFVHGIAPGFSDKKTHGFSHGFPHGFSHGFPHGFHAYFSVLSDRGFSGGKESARIFRSNHLRGVGGVQFGGLPFSICCCFGARRRRFRSLRKPREFCCTRHLRGGTNDARVRAYADTDLL